MTLSVYGASGFVGGNFCRLFGDKVVCQEREERKPRTDEILYLISTVDNYNVHTNITLDVETNLKVLCEVLDYCRDGNITFNFISSWFVYGETELPAKEEYYCMPTGFYSITIMHVNDVCRAIELVCREGNLNEIYNIGSGQPTPISAIIETAKEYLGSTSSIKGKEAPEFHKLVQTKDFWMDTSKLKRLGFTQEIDNDQIIQELCQ